MNYTPSEIMVCAASRMIKNGERLFVGIGMPNLASNLAKRIHAPDVTMIYEAGVVGANPSRLPLSIGDPCLITGSQAVCSMFEVFSFYLQNGLIDVGFLGGAQIDRYGNINTTVIGNYDNPKVRLPGSGGACEIATHAKKLLILTPHQKIRLPEKVDYITSPGFVGGKAEWKKLGIPGGGPYATVTDKAVMKFHEQTGEMYVYSMHPGVTKEEIIENTGWDIMFADEIETTTPPSEEELRIIREVLDPKGFYIKKG